MGNWNICEDDYPGPYEAPRLTLDDWKRVIFDMSRQYGKAFSAIADQITEQLNHLTDLLTPLPRKPQRVHSEVRAHALWLVQNRNTGPRPVRQFYRDGRRTR